MRLLALLLLLTTALLQAASPNLVVIFIDDMGYADIGPFGAKGYATPNLDKMAAQGTKLHEFPRGAARVLGLAHGLADRLLSEPRGHPWGAETEREAWHC